MSRRKAPTRGPGRRRRALAAAAPLAVAFAGALVAGRGLSGPGTALLAAGATAAALATLPGGLPGLGRRWLRALAPAGALEPAAGEAGPASVPHLAGRPAWIPGGLLLVAVAVAGTAGNRFSLVGAISWAASIGVLLAALSDAGEARRPAPALPRALALALLSLTIAAGLLRFGAFASTPPEPTSDHVEKALDALRIAEGARPVFCPANGGREPLQMYLLALLALLPGLGLDLHGLTFLSALEGTLSIPLFFVAGRELARPHGAMAANGAGLATAALAAACGWHVVLSRLGLRIVLLPAATLLLLVFLLRAARGGRRRDWLASGLILGLSLYTYQSARFLPFLAAGAALLSARGTAAERGRLLRNLAASALVAAACAAPLARYALEFPDEFWRRARTRVLGDDAPADTAAALRARLPALAEGIAPALSALHVRGDRAWFQAAPGRPLLDPASVGLLAVGLGACVARALRKRDRGALLVPVALVLLLLPSAVAAAFAIENPSATRASGAVAPALLLAGAGLERTVRATRTWRREVAFGGGASIVLLSGLAVPARLSEWHAAYASAAHPHRALGAEVAAFVRAGGRFGNVFVVGVAHGPDERAVAMEAGFTGRSPGLYPEERPLAGAFAAAAAGEDGRRPDFDAAGPALLLLSKRDRDALEEVRRLWPRATVRPVAAAGPGGGFVAVDVPSGTAVREPDT